MSRRPQPAALLVDHPAFPLPSIRNGGLEPDLADAVSIGALSRIERRRCAAQLLAACSLAAEFDFWPGKQSLRKAVAFRRDGGAQAVFSAFPMPFAETVKRLGPSDSSFERVRAAAVDAIAEATAVAASELAESSGSGYFLEGYLRKVLDDLGTPLDAMTGRNLWAYHWRLPDLPEMGEVVFWKSPRIDVARRFCGAAWAALARRNLRPLLSCDGRFPVEQSYGVPLIIGGRLTEESLAAAERWARKRNASSLVIGIFPAGWHAPGIPDQTTGAPLSAQLAVAGVSLDRARREVDARDGTFDPSNPVDRNALGEAARRRFSPPPKIAVRVAGMASDQVHRVLSLRREGLSAEKVMKITGESAAGMAMRISEGLVVADEDMYRLPTPPRLRRDPLHTAIAEDFEASDPQRWLHEALGGDSSTKIEEWARTKLDHLENHRVREVLGQVESGELGQKVAALLTEACLGELDLSGAREAVSGLLEEDSFFWRLWIDAVDHPKDWRLPRIEWRRLLERAPRVAVETGLLEARRILRGHPGSKVEAEDIVDRALGRLAGKLASWYQIEKVSAFEPDALFDVDWAERVTCGDTALGRFLDHKRAIRLKSKEHFEAARSLLAALADQVVSPGRLAQVFFDLTGAVEDSEEEASFLLRAMRLFEVAGFKHKKAPILFNLAMLDIEQLRLDRAQRRLDEGRIPHDVQMSLGEAMLTLGRGDLDRFVSLAAALPADLGDDRLHRSCEMVKGVAAFLRRRFEEARKRLEAGGEDGEPWLAVLSTVEGSVPTAAPARDPWGITEVCGLIDGYQEHGAAFDSLSADGLDARQALGIAVADHVMARPAWLDGPTRSVVVSVLKSNGCDGWAENVAREARPDLAPLCRAVQRLADTGSLNGIGSTTLDAVLQSLGVTGLEIFAEPGGESVFRGGSGEVAETFRHGSLSMAALGHRPSSKDAWGLLTSVLRLIAPSSPTPADPEMKGTLGFVGESRVVEELREGIRRAAPSLLAVLLVGETGVGKELAARAIHANSGRSGAFEAVNVAAVPDTLFEATMFGVVKGAFTGAHHDRPGVAEAAHGGTLFLDEIGELGLALQVKLLRFLDSGEVRRVGSTHCRQVDVRVVSATNKDLGQMVEAGTFREDLYYRINCVTLRVPPLRDRGEDIVLLRDYLAREAVHGAGLRPAPWSREAENRLRTHAWPGNVRELRQVVGEALLRAGGDLVTVDHLPRSVVGSDRVSAEPRKWDTAHRELRLELIQDALSRHGGNRAAAARELGITRQTLLYHLRNLGLN